jgi:hypothetical protein
MTPATMLPKTNPATANQSTIVPSLLKERWLSNRLLNYAIAVNDWHQ